MDNSPSRDRNQKKREVKTYHKSHIEVAPVKCGNIILQFLGKRFLHNAPSL